MTSHNIVVATDLTGDGLQLLQAADDVTLHVARPGESALRSRLADAQALIVRGDVTVDSELLEHAPQLRVIGLAGASLGSIFKNPHGDYAGRLIEAAGLKGSGVGAVQVSPIHANFLVNQGGDAKASDYYSLIKLVQKRVYERFRVQLELEIQVLGDWS